jgi:hypothetical protein
MKYIYELTSWHNGLNEIASLEYGVVRHMNHDTFFVS